MNSFYQARQGDRSAGDTVSPGENRQGSGQRPVHPQRIMADSRRIRSTGSPDFRLHPSRREIRCGGSGSKTLRRRDQDQRRKAGLRPQRGGGLHPVDFQINVSTDSRRLRLEVVNHERSLILMPRRSSSVGRESIKGSSLVQLY